jgi:ribosome-associated protein
MNSGSDSAGETLRLDQFLKLRGITDTGGQAKLLIQGGEVTVNGQLETRRRRRLVIGDIVEIDGNSYTFDTPPS